MNALRLPTSNTTEATKVTAVMNEVYRDILLRGDGQWWWLIDRTVTNTTPEITTGTASVTNNSTTVTLSSAPAASVAGAKFYVSANTADSQALYRISAHTAGTTGLTLDAAYTGDTNTAASYYIWTDEYDLPTDFGKPHVIQRYGYDLPLEIITPDQMFDLKLSDRRTGKPHYAAVHNFATSGDPTTQRRLIVHPFPDTDRTRLEISYFQTLNTELSGTTRPLIPDDYVQLLVYGTLAAGYPIFLNDVVRGQYFQARFVDLLNLMLAQQRKFMSNTRLVVNDGYRLFYRDRRSTAGVNLGSLFDRYPTIP